MISLRQLRYFLALSETLHFRKAAEQVGISQPALSLQVRQLEDVLGVLLIERSGSGVSVTPEGQRIAARARGILNAVGDLRAMAQEMQGTLKGELRLGLIPTVAPYLLPRLLPALRTAYPELRLNVREAVTEALTADLLSGRIDAMVAALPIEAGGLAHIPLMRDRFMLAVPKARLADIKVPVGNPALMDETLLFLDEGHCLRDQTLSFCRHAGVGADGGLGAASLTTLFQMVANGLGVTLVPELAARHGAHPDEIAILPLAEPQPSRDLALFHRQGSPRQRDFAALAALMR